MIILKCTKNIQFEIGHNLSLKKCINKSLKDAIDIFFNSNFRNYRENELL